MELPPSDVTGELLWIVGVLGSTWFLSNIFNSKERSLLDRIFKRHNKISNIYQLVPILQKNSKKLFLFFTDLASSIKSVKSVNEKNITREVVESILSQEYYKNKVLDLQNEVFKEFKVDSKEVQRAIEKFEQDDQVQYYVSGVKRMFESVLAGGFPQCPGMELNQEMSEKKHLEILEKLAISKTRNWLKNGPQKREKEELRDPEFEETVTREMAKFGYNNYLDALVAIKNSENHFSYYPSFERAKLEMLSKVRRVYNSTEVQKVSGEELKLIVATSEEETAVLALVFDDLINEKCFNELARISNSENPLKEVDRFREAPTEASVNSDPGLKGEWKRNELNQMEEWETVPSVNDRVNGSSEKENESGKRSTSQSDRKGEEVNGTNTRSMNGNAVEKEESKRSERNGQGTEVLKEGELDEGVQKSKIAQEKTKGNSQLNCQSERYKVVTVWLFRDEFPYPEKVKVFPSLVVFRDGSLEVLTRL